MQTVLLAIAATTWLLPVPDWGHGLITNGGPSTESDGSCSALSGLKKGTSADSQTWPCSLHIKHK